MQRQAKGAIALLLLLLAAIALAYVFLPVLKDNRQVASSDAVQSKGIIRVGVDNFVGYFPLCSPHLRQLMLAEGWDLRCVDDSANYLARFKALGEGSINLAVATVDSYVLAGKAANYPGVILAVLDQSSGADAILARTDAVKDLGELARNPNVKVAYTPDSPSDYLLKRVAVDFDIPALKPQGNQPRLRASGSSEACEKLLSGEAQVAVCWEPDVSRLLAKGGVVKLLGTEQTSRYIVDILLANRSYLEGNGEAVKTLLNNYFKTLKYYRDNPDPLRKDVAGYAGVSETLAGQMVGGVSWVNLNENAKDYFGLSAPGEASQFGLIEVVNQTIKTLQSYGDFLANPLPNEDPRRIINSAPLASIFRAGLGGGSNVASGVSSLRVAFAPLNDKQWDKLPEFGTLKVRPILFRSGSDQLTLSDKEQLDELADTLKGYPKSRIEIQGHTKKGSNEEANRTLSEERAASVAQYLKVTYGVDENRIRVVGFGSSKPAAHVPGLSYREEQDRNARVEIHLKKEDL